MFPQKVQKPLVIGRLHVEQVEQHLVVAPRVLQSGRHNRPHVVARQVARHERSVDRRPERFAVTHDPLEQQLRAPFIGAVGGVAAAGDAGGLLDEAAGRIGDRC